MRSRAQTTVVRSRGRGAQVIKAEVISPEMTDMPAMTPQEAQEAAANAETQRILLALRQKQEQDQEAVYKYNPYDGPTHQLAEEHRQQAERAAHLGIPVQAYMPNDVFTLQNDPAAVQRLQEEVNAREQVMRMQMATRDMTEQIAIQNQIASEQAGYPVQEGVPQPSHQPIGMADMLAREKYAQSQGQYPGIPPAVYNPAQQAPPLPVPTMMRPPHVFQIADAYNAPPVIEKGKAAPPGCLRDMEGNLFRADCVMGVDVQAGTRSGGTSKKVVAHTSLGERVMAVTINADVWAENYRDEIMSLVFGPVSETSEDEQLQAVAA